MAESREFRALLEAKERELLALCDQQIQTLNSQIREKETAVAELKDQISQLQDDFKYNLGLLDSRDAELAQYDVSTAALQASVSESEERVKVARKALSDAETIRVQEKGRADELEQISQNKISNLQKEIEGLQRSKEELLAKAKQELESTKTELKDLHAGKIKELEQERKKELDEATNKSNEKIAKAEARVKESAENVESAEKRAEAAEKQAEAANENSKKLKKELEAALAKQKEDASAAAEHEKQRAAKEEELKSIIDQKNKSLEDLEKQLKESKDANVNEDPNVNKDASVNAVDPSSYFKEQLQELKAHHTAAVDLFKGEIDLLRNKLEGSNNQMRTLETSLRKELEEKARELMKMEEEHKGLHNSYLDLQKELAGNLQYEGTSSQGLGLAGGGSGSSSSYPALSPPMSHGLSPEDAIKINHGKLAAENNQLRARCEELSSQNDRIRDVVGAMRLEMEALQKRTKIPSESQPSSPIKKRTGVKHLREEVEYLKAIVQDISDELGDLRAVSPTVHFETPERQPTSPKSSGVLPIRRPKSSTKLRSPSQSRSSRSPHAVMPTSPDSPLTGAAGDRAAGVEIVNSSLRAQLEAAKTDMTRIIKERDLLMELSNGLRADLSKIVLSSGAEESTHNSHFVPPSLTAQVHTNPSGLALQFQHDFERDTIPRNTKLMTGTSNPRDVAHASRARTISPSSTRFRADAKTAEPSSKQWGYGVGPGGTKEKPEMLGLQMEGTSYRHERPLGVHNDPLHKGTSSQRARFKAAIKRKEELSRPKVRHWNIKDDHPPET